MRIALIIMFFINLFFGAIVVQECVFAGQKNRLAIISPHWEGIRREFSEAFGRWHKRQYLEDVEIEWLDLGGTSDDLRFIEAEFNRSPDGIGVDIFWGGGFDPYLKLSTEGVLLSYRMPDELLSKIPSECLGMPIYDSEFRWYGTAMAGFGIVYNKPVLRLMGLYEPKTWSDLANPRLTGWVSSADPRESGSIHVMYELILQIYGWEKGFETITRICANTKAFATSAGHVINSVASGDTAYGLAIDFYAWAKMAEVGKDNLGYVLPEEETVISLDPIAILKGAPNLGLAKRFVQFVMSEEGQKLWMLPIGSKDGPKKFYLNRMSILPALYDDPDIIVPVNPFSRGTAQRATTFRFDSDKAAKRWGLINDLIGVSLIDNHKMLVNAWRAIQKGGMKEEAVKNLVNAPLSEAEAMEYASRWDDYTFRNNVHADWVVFTQGKYAGAAKISGVYGVGFVRAFLTAVRYFSPVCTVAFFLFLFTRKMLYIAKGQG
ncbi:MAG TPA: ABC transporter substrate-binding protein [Candidatus Brocadiia bacterium]|nr:ABC transporter substrate-binding protein [Candidatus Brocadiales bacterium]